MYDQVTAATFVHNFYILYTQLKNNMVLYNEIYQSRWNVIHIDLKILALLPNGEVFQKLISINLSNKVVHIIKNA